MHPYRTHTCGALRKSDAGAVVRLSGWVHRKRDHGGLVFIDLRDHYGLTQVVLEPENPNFDEASRLRDESVVTVTGKVVPRPAETVNANLPTGEIELVVEEIVIRSVAEQLPLPIFGEPDYPEETRLTYRFLDLRRETLHKHIMLRAGIIRAIRQGMEAQGFTDFQTPILTASSPEGARDFLVPSRLYPGKFYALPQAPQQFKQLTMVAGFDRYYQIAPCFRDEDARADRSAGEFYQLDVEMSFVEQADVHAAVGKVTHDVFKAFAGDWSVTPFQFPYIPFKESMLKYGNDKPDLRIPLVIADVTEIFRDESVTFQAFKGVIAKGGVVRAIPAPGAGAQPRGFFDKLNDWARAEMKAPGLGYIIFEEDGGALTGKGPIAKFVPAPLIARLAELAGCKAGDAVFFACDTEAKACQLGAQARVRIGEQLGLKKEKSFEFCWIVDFPIYEYNETDKKIDFSHNPFSMPDGGLEALNTRDPLTINGRQYDLVCNGYELGSGAVRNHEPETLIRAFEIAGYTRAEVERQFSGMLNAFRYGAPPHGGIALGIERIVMLLAHQANIREVTMFPMNQQAQDLLMGAPAEVTAKQLQELHIRVVPPPQKKVVEG